MRVGIYCGRHAGHGGGIGLYTRSLLENYLNSLSDSTRGDELYIYAESTILDGGILQKIRAFNARPRGSQGKVVVRQLPETLGRKVGMLIDQGVVPKWVDADRIAVLHCTANIAILRARCPQIVTVHDLFQGWPKGASQPSIINRFYRKLFERQFGASCKHLRFLTDCKTVADEISERFPVAHERISVVPLGIDNALTQFLGSAGSRNLEAEVNRWLRSRGLSPGYVILFASTDSRKNLGPTLNAWRQVPTALKRPLVARCLDPEAASVLASSADRNPSITLDWLDREELFFLYLGGAALLSPTLAEGYGLPTVESIALGCPVVTSPIDALGALPATVFEVVKAHVCNPESTESIRGAIEKCLEPAAQLPDDRLVAHRVQSLRLRGLSGLPTLEETARRTFELYRDIERTSEAQRA
ncbi:MAG: glycosyltransferase [Bdellovibrionota bacterium]